MTTTTTTRAPRKPRPAPVRRTVVLFDGYDRRASLGFALGLDDEGYAEREQDEAIDMQWWQTRAGELVEAGAFQF